LSFGYERFRKQVESLAQKTPQEIGEGLISCVDDFVDGEHQEDDQTLVVLKRTN
jgi:serine phosphatase RsbU (regulator of sigma subunit)